MTSTLESLLPAARRLARHAARRWALDPDECESEALLACWRASLSHREEAGPLGGWTRYKAKMALVDLARKVNGRKRHRRRPDSLDDPVPGADGRPALLRDTLPGREGEPGAPLEAEEGFAGLTRPLTDRERHVLARHYRDGLTLAEVAGELGVSPAMASLLHRQALRWLRGVLREEADDAE